MHFETAERIEEAFRNLPSDIQEKLSKPFTFQKEIIPPAEGQLTAGTFVPSRGFSDDLCYGVGFSYLGGLIAGSAWGAFSGMRDSSFKTRALSVRYTKVLNEMTTKGPAIGNMVGSIVTLYNISRLCFSELGLNNTTSTLLASGISGALVRSPNGISSAMRGGTICTLCGAAWLFIKQ